MQLSIMDGGGAANDRRLKDLLSDYAYGCDLWPEATPDAAARHALEEMPTGCRVLAASENDGWQWAAALQPLAFDSEIFGASMGRICLWAHRAGWPSPEAHQQGRSFMGGVLDAARDMGLRFLSLRLPGRDLLAAGICESLGFRLMDVSVDWQMDLAAGVERPRLPDGFGLREGSLADLETLQDLVAGAFCDLEAYADRFAMDPGLRAGCPELYRRWTANSLRGQAADQVLVLEGGGQTAGIITLTRHPGGSGPGAECGWVILNSIAPRWRGRGLYRHLLQGGLEWLAGQGASSARVRTKISQLAVIRAWSSLGARQVYSANTFHLWLDQN